MASQSALNVAIVSVNALLQTKWQMHRRYRVMQFKTHTLNELFFVQFNLS